MSGLRFKETLGDISLFFTRSPFIRSALVNPVLYSVAVTLVIAVVGYIIFKDCLDLEGSLFKYMFYVFVVNLCAHTMSRNVTMLMDQDKEEVKYDLPPVSVVPRFSDGQEYMDSKDIDIENV